MNVLHIIGELPKAAGTSVFCGEIANGLVKAGHAAAVAVQSLDCGDVYPLDSRVRIVYIASVLQTTHPKYWSLVHIHGLWVPVLHKAAKWACRHGIPLVWSPHGMLTPWAMYNKWWKKYLAWWLYQRRDMTKADLLHVTADSEVEDVRRMGLKNKVVIEPLGVKIDGRVGRVKCVDGKKTLLFVSRVQRKKGLLNLVRAWAKLKQESLARFARSPLLNDWLVRIVGPDQDNHTAELKALCNELSVAHDFEFVGPKYGEELQREYAAAELFVLPTHSENFGSVVIEALSHAVPVITTKGAPWTELEERKCGWWVDIGVEPLAAVLKEAMELDDSTRRAMGARGRKLVEEKYTWDVVVKKMLLKYDEVLNGWNES